MGLVHLFRAQLQRQQQQQQQRQQQQQQQMVVIACNGSQFVQQLAPNGLLQQPQPQQPQLQQQQQQQVLLLHRSGLKKKTRSRKGSNKPKMPVKSPLSASVFLTWA